MRFTVPKVIGRLGDVTASRPKGERVADCNVRSYIDDLDWFMAPGSYHCRPYRWKLRTTSAANTSIAVVAAALAMGHYEPILRTNM